MKHDNVNLPPPAFEVKRIKPINLYLNENGLPPDALYRVDFKHQFKANSLGDIVALELQVVFTLDDREDASKNRIVLDCTVQNVFEVHNLSAYIADENNIRLPNETIISFVSLSVSHTRAVMAILTAGTLFQENLLPIINPVEMAKAFFPEYTPARNIKPEEKQERKKIVLAPARESKKRRAIGNPDVLPVGSNRKK
jgi:hypothetical protein